jgi:hypothetical protein
MPPSFDCVLINGTLVSQDGIGATVAFAGQSPRLALGQAAAGERLDCRGLRLPGVIIPKCIFANRARSRRTWKPDRWRSGSVTAVFEMPNMIH